MKMGYQKYRQWPKKLEDENGLSEVQTMTKKEKYEKTTMAKKTLHIKLTRTSFIIKFELREAHYKRGRTGVVQMDIKHDT